MKAVAKERKPAEIMSFTDSAKLEPRGSVSVMRNPQQKRRRETDIFSASLCCGKSPVLKRCCGFLNQLSQTGDKGTGVEFRVQDKHVNRWFLWFLLRNSSLKIWAHLHRVEGKKAEILRGQCWAICPDLFISTNRYKNQEMKYLMNRHRTAYFIYLLFCSILLYSILFIYS